MADKRIMRAFKLSEISGVTRPAQEGATVAIMKRDFSDDDRKKLADKGQALPDGSFPIVTAADLKNAVQAFGRAKDPAKAKAHIMARAKALGATDSLPSDWVGKSAGDTGSTTSDNGDPEMLELKKKLGLAETATDADVLAAVAKINDTATSSAAILAAINKADMSDKHSAFMSNAKAAMPKGGKSAFMAMSPSERDDHMKSNPIGGDSDGDDAKKFADAVAKAAANDEVLKVGDLDVRKSAVGDATFAILKAQQVEIAKERDARETVEFAKRADTEIPALPGESIAKGKALRAIAKLGEEDRKTVEAMLKAGNEAMRSRLKEIGKGGGDGADTPDQKLEALAKAHAETHKVDFAKAYNAVLESEEGRRLYAASRGRAA